VALDVQKQIKDRLSIQYFDSNYNNGAAGNFACCGIFENDFVSFYLSKMQVIPWSNVNAGFQDGSRYCFLGTARDSSQISETPNYRIASIGPAQQISTHTGIESVNIANIKSILDQNHAVEFDFYLTQGADWDAFTGWWSSQPESAVWSGSFSCGRPLYSIWNGHAVVCVGYDDSDANPSNHYWLMLNSWGTAPARPNDLLRIPMHYDYECADSSGGYNTFWYTIPVAYAGPSPTSPTVTNGSGATGITALTATLNGNLVSTGNSSAAIRIFWGTNDGGTTPERWANNIKLGILPTGAFASTVMGLMPDTLYHYRCAATNLVATSWAHTSASFRTPSTSPAGPPSSSASISSTPVLLPNVRVENASLSASKVSPGTPVTVTANIANGSNVNGASLIRLYVNGQEEPGKSVAVAGGDRVLLTFTVSRDEPGTYSVFVAGAQAGSFIVDPFPSPDTILFISFGLIGFAFIIGTAYLASKPC